MYVLTIRFRIPEYQVNQMDGDMERRDGPKSSTIHVDLRAENTLFSYMRTLEMLVVYLILRMQRCGAGFQQARAHVNIFCILSAVLPGVRSRILEVPAIFESRIRLVH